MKISLRHLFLSAVAAGCFSLTSAVFAQDNKQSDPASAEPAAGRPAPAPAVTPTEPAAVAPAEQSPVVTPPADQPVAQPVETSAAPTEPAAISPEPAPEAQPKVETTVPAPASAESVGDKPEASPKVENSEPPKLRRLDEESPAPTDSKAFRKTMRAHGRHGSSGNEIVNFWGNSVLPKGQKADSVISVLGSSTSEGEVSDAVVSVFGSSRVTGPVGDAVVSVLGNTYVDAKVGDAVVAVLGNVELGPNAEVNDVVAVGGKVIRDPKAIVHGHINNVGTGGKFSDLEWLHSWIENCALYFRPLAFGPHLMWAWWIALGFLGFYILLALIAPKGVSKCAETFEQRPGYSILAALLTVLLAPVAILLLVFTVVGIAVIPFLAAGIFFATLFGKTVMLAWIGRRFGKLIGSDSPVLAVLIGGVVVLLLYTVPVLGLILYKLLGWVGLGVVIYTLILGMKREKPPTVVPNGTIDPATGLVSVPLVMTAATLPRAGFWIRLAALLLDVIIVGMLCNLLSGFFSVGSHVHIKADLLPALALYGALMWKLRGSTVGGIVCGLKVIRLDDRPLDWGTAIVRALSCFLSLFVLGLGFIWVAFDDQRQSWHDKIAGTTVVRVPKGVSLV